MLNDKFQGKGYAYEAARAFFDYLFKEKKARRIYAYTEDNNTASTFVKNSEWGRRDFSGSLSVLLKILMERRIMKTPISMPCWGKNGINAD